MKRISVGVTTLGDKESLLVNDVIQSGWLSPGPKVAEFEEKFAARHDCKYGVMFNSGTDALRIALATLKETYNWQDGDEVIVPALTFIATSNIVIQNGMKPVFVDVDPNDFLIDYEKIRSALTIRTRCIIPVHLFGQPADVFLVNSFAPGIQVIEDSCETMGVGMISSNGSKRSGMVGSLGAIGCFSTYSCHLLVTGVGGIATTNNAGHAELMRSYLNHGRDPYYLGFHGSETKDPAELIAKRFLYHRIGYSSRATEIEGALGLAQLERLDWLIGKRRVNAAYLTGLLGDLELLRILRVPRQTKLNRNHSWMLYPIVITDPELNRDKVCLALEEEGIETRPLFPLLTQPIYRKLFPGEAEKHPVALQASQNGFYIGCHQGLEKEDLERISDVLHKVCKREVKDAVAC